MKKLLCVLLALCMLAALPACRKKPSDENGAVTDSSTSGNFMDELPANEYRQDQFRIMTISGNIPDDAQTDRDVVGRALFDRDVALEDHYGVTIQYSEVKNNSTAIADMQIAVSSGMEPFHAFITSAERLMSLAASGYVEDLNAVDHLQMEQDWWSQSLNQNCTINNVLYCSAGPYSEYFYHSAICLAYNKTIESSYENMDIYGAVLNGTWTLDLMKTYCVDYNVTKDNGDGVWDENDTYAISANSSLMYGLFAGAGGRFCERDDNGSIEISIGSESSQQILGKVLDVFREENGYYNKYEESAKQFTNGNALFLYTSTGYLCDYLPSSNVDYGIIPLPKLNEKQDYITCAWPASNFCVSIPRQESSEEKGFAGLMLESYCYISYHLVRPAKYGTVLKFQVSPDPTASDLMDIIFQNLYFDLNLVFNFGKSRDLVQNVLKNHSMNRYTALVSSIQGDIDEDIGNLLNVKKS